MPNKWTFGMDVVKKFLKAYAVGTGWVDPFGAKNKLAEHTNDFMESGTDANVFLSRFDDCSIQGALFDPPYSMEQVKRAYGSLGVKDWQTRFGNNKNGGFPTVKAQIQRILKPGGICISFGWNSNGMGKGRGFEIIDGLIIAHGGNRHDTIIIVERKS